MTGGTHPGVGAAGAAPWAVQLGTAGELRLELGQVLRAKVLEPTDAGVLLELAGRRVHATTDLPLQEGATYDLVVLAREPRIVLAPAGALALPTAARALARGQLGPPLAELARVLQAPPEAEGGALRWVGELARRWDAGRIEAADLSAYHRRLGHDQEAAVLRLPARDAAEHEIERLQGTLKAQALRALPADAAPAEAGEPSWARAVVGALRALETENARRADRGAPQLLSLPFGLGGAVADARLFVVPPGERDAAGTPPGARPFTVVLLLALSRLGRLRVDVELAGTDVDLRFEAEHAAALEALRTGSAALTDGLAHAGLRVRRVALRHAGDDGIRVADLASPATADEVGGTVDLHV